MADEKKIPPPPVFTSEMYEQEREQKDVNRLQRLPPLEYDRMNKDQRLAFIQWYQQTAECRDMLKIYPKDYIEAVFASYPTEAPADTPLSQSLMESFKCYSQQAWSSKRKRPPQPSSYFLFHKKFSRLIDQGIRLPVHKDIVPALLFTLQEVNQIGCQGLKCIVTAVGSHGLHFHEVGTVHPNDNENLYIYLRQNACYFLSANREFVKQEITEVWFRRAKHGTPHFIFCPAVSAELPLLALPLSSPGEPKLLLELSRLEAMPALHLQRCRAEHKKDFFQWLSTKDKSPMRDEDLENLKLAARLIKLASNDFNVAKPKMPRDELVRLYEKYVQERWSMPSKQLPKPQSVYLFEKKFQPTDRVFITLPQELMHQAVSLVLSAEEFDQLFMSKVLFVEISITTSTHIKLERQGLLQVTETSCMLSCFDGKYNEIFSELISEESFEVWFVRTPFKPKFIIKPR